MKKLASILALAAMCAFGPSIAAAHSGGTDAYGCHVDSKTGIRHCH
ncbi:MAG: YHYH domain-containing protein [Polycyclovorans sp.]|nr:YHYH domain-containing protein [Polycyclovorans sp.]